MLKALAVLLAVASFAVASSAYAEGGKVRADGSEGPAYQLGEVPFTG